MADAEAREDIVQLAVAARGGAPDAALMRGLEALVDGGGSLLDAAGVLTAGDGWEALYPRSQTPEEFADAWLGALLPGADRALLDFGRRLVLAHLNAGGGAAALVLAAQEFLSAPEVPAAAADLARAFLRRSGEAMAELAAAETAEDIVQLAVAAYGAAPGAALMAELETAVDGGLSDAAGVLVADGRWEALYPSSMSPAEFADAWLSSLLPGADADLLAVGREIVISHIEAGGGMDVLVLAAQEFLSGPVAQAAFAGIARAFLNRSEVAAEHSAVRRLDGTAEELRAVLVSVTEDEDTVRAAVDALDGQAPGDQAPGDQMPGDQMPGDQPSGNQPSGNQPSGNQPSGNQIPGGGQPSGGGGQVPAVPVIRDSTDDRNRVVLSEFDEDGDGVHDRAEAYEYGAGDLKIRTVWYDDWALEADGSGKAPAMQTADRALTLMDDNDDGTAESRRHDVYDEDGELAVASLFDDDNAADGSWERAEGYGHDAAGRRVFRKAGADVTGTDPENAAVDYKGGRAEIHILDPDGSTAETRFFDDYDGSSDFAALSGGSPDRVSRFGLDLDGDGGDARDARHDKLNADGRVVESLFDLGGDGVDRAEAYDYDDAGRKTQTRFHDSYDGSFDLSGETADRIHSWTYGDAGDGRWLVFSEDADGDGAPETATAVSYHGGGGIAARTTSRDDGSGGAGADDGTVDRRVRESFDAAGALIVAEYDDDGDGAYERAEAYEYGAGGLKVRTAWYDGWREGTALAGQTADRVLTVVDENGDGTGESRRFDAYAGKLIARSLFDDDNAPDGGWERAEGYEHDAAGRLVLHKNAVAVAGTDPAAAAVVWDRAAIHILNDGGGTAETRFFDAYDGSSDFAALSGGTPDRIHRFGTDHDGDGTADVRRDALDAGGRVVLSVFESGADENEQWAEFHRYGARDLKTLTVGHDDWKDGTAQAGQTVDWKLTVVDENEDGTGESRRFDAYDADGARIVRSLFDDDNAPDGGWERAEGYEHDAAGRLVMKRSSVAVAGTDPAVAAVVWDKAEIRILDAEGGAKEIRFFDAYDGSSDFAALSGGTPERVHRFGEDHDGDGTADVRRDALDAGGRVVLSVFESGADAAGLRAEAYEYGAGGLKILTVWHDDWKDGTAPAGQAVGRTLTVVDENEDGTGESRRLDVYAAAGKLVVRSLFDDDNAPDGGWERAEGYGHDAADRLILHKSADAVDGTDPAEIVWDRARIHVLRFDGGTAETRFFDAYDGSSDFAALAARAPARIHRFGVDHDGDGTADVRRDALDAEGRVVLSVFESGADAADLWAVAYEYGAGGLKIRTAWRDEWKDGTPPVDQAVDWALTVVDENGDGTGESRQYDEYDDGLIVLTLFDDDNAADGAWERAEGYERDASGRLVMEKSGIPGGASDPAAAAVVWSKAEIHILDADGRREQTRFFDSYDGSSDFAALAGGNADRVRLDLDGDLGIDDVRFNKLDGGGRILESLFDYNHDGVDRAESYRHDAAGRKTETRFHDSWTGTFDLSGAAADRIHAWTYSASDTADARWLSFSEDFDGDGKTDRKTEVSRHGASDIIATRRTSRDDGTGGGTADDGVFDSRRLDSYDAGGLIESVKWDDGDDGTWNRSLSYSYTRHENGEVKTRLLEADGGGLPFGFQVEGAAADGTADNKRLDSYDAKGRIESSKRDDDNDGIWERVSTYSHYEGGGIKTESIEFDGAGFPGVDDGVVDGVQLIVYDAEGRRESVGRDDDNDGAYEKVETHSYHDNGALKTTLTEFDDGTGGAARDDGTADRRTLRVRGSDGVLQSVKWDGDNDGAYETIETYGYHDNGGIKTMQREFDDGSRGGTADDGVPDRRMLYIYDGDGALESSGWDNNGDGLLDPWFTLRLGLDLDGDNFAGDYIFDRVNAFDQIVESVFRVRVGRVWTTTRAEAHERDGAGRITETRIHDPYSGGFDLSGEIPDRVHAYAYGADPADARWLTFSEDFDNDGAIDRRTTVTHHGAVDAVATKETEYDDGSGGAGVDDGSFDRRTFFTYSVDGRSVSGKHDDDNDGTYDTHQIDIYVAGGERVDRSLFDVGFDGVWDRIESYQYDRDGRIILRKTGFDPSGAEPETIAAAYTKAELRILSRDGIQGIQFFDDYDGVSDFLDLFGATASRIHRYRLDLDGDGRDDARYDKLDGDGRVVESLFDIDAAVSAPDADRAEAHVYDAAGRKTESRFYDPYAGTFDLSGAAASKVEAWTYAGAADARWRTFSEDFDGDGNIDRKSAATYHSGTSKHRTLEVEYDNGEGADGAVVAGNIDDGTVDLRILTTYTSYGREESVKYDYGNDGSYEKIILALSLEVPGVDGVQDPRDGDSALAGERGPGPDEPSTADVPGGEPAEPITVVGGSPAAAGRRGFTPAGEWTEGWEAY